MSYKEVPPQRGCRAYNSTNQSIANNTSTALTLDSERFDTDAFHSISSNTSRLVVPTGLGGLYLISGSLSWAGTNVAAFSSRFLWIALNGTATRLASQSVVVAAADATGVDQTVTTVYRLVAADYVELFAYQDTGVAINSVSSANYGPELSLVLLGQ